MVVDKVKVSIIKTPPRPVRGQIRRAVTRAIELCGGLPPVIKPGVTVLLKPNLVDVPKSRESGAITHPEVCRAVAELVREAGASPMIADSAGIGTDTEEVIKFMGYQELREAGFPVKDLKKDKELIVRNPGARVLPRLKVYETALKVDAIINLPVLKTHDQTEITLGLKNLKGLLADHSKKRMHRRGVFEGVPELTSFFNPCLTVLDGIYCQEGVGPVFGDPVEMDLIAASTDPLALDIIGGLIIGYRPEEVPITRSAIRLGLGAGRLSEIEVVGASLESVRRRFKRCSETEILGRELPCRLRMAEETCTGCRNTVAAVLVEMSELGLLSSLEGITIVTGCPEIRPEDPPRRVIVGRCARPLRSQGIYVDGCPPENSWLIEALLTGF
ncbi:MAG: DUF362 domain-containing protein [Firmicutes bacterium]|nr:DUF362 domain-containing protein [Bacillota bacterium]